MSRNHASTTPYMTILAGTATYSGVLFYYYRQQKSHDDFRKTIKSISAYHSLAATGLTLLALTQDWPISPQDQPPHSHTTTAKTSPTGIDDSANPMISGQNHLANLLTAWEAGYLIYDTGALLLLAAHKIRGSTRPQSRSAFTQMVKDSPVFITHHVLLITALLYLQRYISLDRQKGMKIIVSLLLMNASNPLLHLRWLKRKATGRDDVKLDVALAMVFAFTRFGTTYWILRAYGAYHGLNAWEAIRKQRWQCQMGTGLLVGLNAVWWVGLVNRLGRGVRRGWKRKVV